MPKFEREPRGSKTKEVALREKFRPFQFLSKQPEKTSGIYAYTGTQAPIIVNLPDSPSLQFDIAAVRAPIPDSKLEGTWYFACVAPFTPQAAYQPSQEDTNTETKLRKWVELINKGGTYIDYSKVPLHLGVQAPFERNQIWFDLENPRLYEDGRIARYFLKKDLKDLLMRVRIWIDFPTGVSYKGTLNTDHQSMDFFDYYPSELGRQAPGVILNSPVGLVMGPPYGYELLLPSSPRLLSQIEMSFSLAGRDELEFEKRRLEER